MKCQKCGAEMVPGHLYCDICGAEYQIVPDFEPEIEYSIAQSMSDISESIEKENNIKSHCLLKKLRRNSVDKHNILDALFEEYSDIKQEVILTQIRDYIKVRKTEIDNSFISIYGKA